MSRRNWNQVAEKQFAALSSDVQEDWGELRAKTLKQDR